MTSKRDSSESWITKFAVKGQGNIIDNGSIMLKNYQIPNKEFETFYCFLGWHLKQKKRHSFTEAIPSGAFAITGRLTINYGMEIEDPFPLSFITKVVRSFQDALLAKSEIEKDKLVAAVITAYSEETYEASMIIQFPLIAATMEDQEREIHPEWRERFRKDNAIGNLNIQPENEIIDRDIFKRPWFLYGARDPIKKYRYELDRFYYYIENEELYDQDPKDVIFEDIFQPNSDCSYVAKKIFRPNFYLDTRKKTRKSSNSTSSSRSSAFSTSRDSTSSGRSDRDSMGNTENIQPDLTIWYPLFLSLNYPIEVIILKEIPKGNFKPQTSFTNNPTDIREDFVQLCKMLPHRIRCKDPYINKIGQAAWRIFDGSHAGFKFWKEITTKEEVDSDNESTASSYTDRGSIGAHDEFEFSNDYDDNNEDIDINKMFQLREDDLPGFHAGKNISEDERLWNNFRLTDTDNYTIDTIKHLASIYSRENYDSWVFTNYHEEFILSTLIIEKPVADLFSIYYPCNFIWTGSAWYYYRNHRWNYDGKEGTLLVKYLGDEKEFFVKKIRQHRRHLQEIIDRERDPVVKLELEAANNKIDTLIKKLWTRQFKSNVISELKSKYLRADFEKICDENPYILVFKNCILEFRGTKVYERPGLPEDYCTYSTGIRYLRKINPENEKFIRIYMNQVYTDPQTRNWIWCYFTSGLVGGNPDKMITMHQGKGNNSKTQIIKLLEYSFGDYFVVGGNSEVLANARMNKSGPEPEKIRRKGRRWNVYNELDEKQPLDVATFKSLSGDDSQGGARDTFAGAKSMVNMRLNAKTMMIFNKDPPFAGRANDDALWDRVAKVVYSSKWVKNAPSDFLEQWKLARFHLDSGFSEYLRDYAESFMTMLVRSWSFYKKHKLPICKKITEDSAAYRRKADICQLYIEQRLELHYNEGVPDPKFKKTITQLHQDFVSWYTGNYPGSDKKTILNKEEFQSEMDAKSLHYESNYFIGVSLKIVKKKREARNEEEEDEEETKTE